MISILRQFENSSGNGGAAIAAYAGRRGDQGQILVPATTQPGKTVQMRAYGAEVDLIPCTRHDTVLFGVGYECRSARQVFETIRNVRVKVRSSFTTRSSNAQKEAEEAEAWVRPYLSPRR
jgi:threonine synthase